VIQDTNLIPATFTSTSDLTEAQYHEWYTYSLRYPGKFWGEQARRFITWFAPWETVLTNELSSDHTIRHHYHAQWFTGAKLNAAYNCLDRHLATQANQPALIWEGNDPKESSILTYKELYELVCRFASVLKKYGISKGTCVCIYLPMIPEAIVAMLACARIGAIHSVVFAGFSPKALKARIMDANCRMVITANESIRGNKVIPLKKHVDIAVQDCCSIQTVITVKRTKNPVSWQTNRDIWYHEAMQQVTSDCPAEPMDAQDSLFILYTSGSTGKPKGILHGTGGYLVYTAATYYYIFNYHPGDIYWCTADIGWITGHSYNVYGPLLNGATIIIHEGTPYYPTPARYWEIVDKYQVNVFYTAPTAIRALRHEGDGWVKQTSRRSLRLLGSVGEPINEDAWKWYYHVIGQGHCPIVDTWWQTETGGIMISPLPGATPLKPGSATWPFFGIVPTIVDDNGHVVPSGTMGKLLITQPWPGMMKTIYGDHQQFIATYFQAFPGYYLTGDQAYRDSSGYYWITGRNDDIIKVSGHRIGTQEVENTLSHHPAVSETAVVAIEDPMVGQSIYAFVTLKRGFQPSISLKESIIQTVREQIGPIATPKYIQWAAALPKTRSGKIMRRLLRHIANDEVTKFGDLTTLADANLINELIKERQNEKV
jgi:acetyl-CoA synthetase